MEKSWKISKHNVMKYLQLRRNECCWRTAEAEASGA